MPTSTPEASSHGEGKEIGTVDGIKVGVTTGFGMAAMPTGTPEASSRGEGASGRSLARPPCPQLPQGHHGVAKGSSDRSSARPAVSIFGERGDTLRPARTSAYSAPGNTSHRSGARHIQWAPAYSESAWRFSRGRRRRGMDPRHIQWTPRHIHRAPGISRARRRRGCRLCPSHRRGSCRSGWRGWSG